MMTQVIPGEFRRAAGVTIAGHGRRLPRAAPILMLLEQLLLSTSYSCITLLFAATTLLQFPYLLLKVFCRRR